VLRLARAALVLAVLVTAAVPAVIALAGGDDPPPRGPDPRAVAAVLDTAVLAGTPRAPAGTRGGGACVPKVPGAAALRCERTYVSPARVVVTVARYEVAVRDGCLRGRLTGGWPQLEGAFAPTPRRIARCGL
jgi:hypothetical protein